MSLENKAETYISPSEEQSSTNQLINSTQDALSNGAGPSGTAPSRNILDYSTHFPELQISGKPVVAECDGAWSRPPAISLSECSVMVLLQDHERALKPSGKCFGNGNEESQHCKEIAKATNTRIELCISKCGSLTIVISGTKVNVEEAQQRIYRELKEQAVREIQIPKDHHRILIGKEGAKLRQLEQETFCRIAIPPRTSTSDIIKITGPPDGIEKAIQSIQLISDAQSKLAEEHIVVPKIFYPWIRGPFNETCDAIMMETGARINIPPPSAASEMIVVNGPREGVYQAAEAVRQIYEQKKNTVKAISLTVARAQHRYIIGPQRKFLNEILKETNVSVELPAEEEESDIVTLRGEEKDLVTAAARVLEKAVSIITSEIICEPWMHKFLIGPKGSILQTLLPTKLKTHLEFEDDGRIFLEGPPDEVKMVIDKLTDRIDTMRSEMSSKVIKVHPTLHRHVIGRGGASIIKIKEETGVQITIPDEKTNSDEIRVEGENEGVQRAIDEITEIVKRIENEASRDILIEQRFHKQIIGAKGEAIQKLREQFPSVTFTFPDVNVKSDIVTLRGDKDEVNRAYKRLTVINKELVASNYQSSVPIYKEFHKHIIGKGGANIRRIRDETQTRIDLPNETTGEDKIIVTGTKANVDKAIKQLMNIQNELANIVNVEISIIKKIHSRMLSNSGRLIIDVQDECGGVIIKFPPEKGNSDKVSIRGPKEEVAKAQKLLAELAKDLELSSFEDTTSAKPEFHRFLIGRGGAKIRKVREMYPKVRILFPREAEENKETIHLVGTKDEVAKVKQRLEEMINELKETVELATHVDPKYHRHFMIRGAAVLREIQDQNGGVTISFPRLGSNDTKVVIKGSKQCAECAKIRIEEIVDNLNHQIVKKVKIPAIHHRSLLSNRGKKIIDLSAKYSVQIRFPDRRFREDMQRPASDVNNEEAIYDESLFDQVTISGYDTNCEQAAVELMEMIPVSKVVNVAFEYRRFLIGRSGENIRNIMQAYMVTITMPAETERSDEVVVTGTLSDVDAAITDILRQVQEFEEAAEDRRLRSYKMNVEIPVEYHLRLIGPRGRVVNSLRSKHGVQITFPRSEDNSNVISITGYQKSCEACKADMMRIVEEVQSLFAQEVILDASFHPRLIGTKGKNLRRVMDDYCVEIRFPRANDPDPNLVVVAGKSEERVMDCIDHLRLQEEMFMEERADRGFFNPVLEVTNLKQPTEMSTEVEIMGAPWQLDMGSDEQFPPMNLENAGANVPGAWCGSRRF